MCFWIYTACSVLKLLLFVTLTECLTCYKCDRVTGTDGNNANYQCLAGGRETTCSQFDRCYSYRSGNQVEKGCTRPADCYGSKICCTEDYCNAGINIYSQTGYGRGCNDASKCVAGFIDMACVPGQDGVSRCQCLPQSYRVGSTCRTKHAVNESCVSSDQCYDGNATCTDDGYCRCIDNYFNNATICQMMRLPGEHCSKDHHCLDENSVCRGNICSCIYGYRVERGDNFCSGTNKINQTYGFLMCSLLLHRFITSFFSLSVEG